MNFSSTSLLKIQRLARVVKKELRSPMRIKYKEEIGSLLRRAGSEKRNVNILEAYNDFISTLTEEERVELIACNVSITLNVNSSVEEVTPVSLQHAELDAPPSFIWSTTGQSSR